jgi:hypothetical protein
MTPSLRFAAGFLSFVIQQTRANGLADSASKLTAIDAE